MKSKKPISGREKQRRHKQRQSQWERENPAMVLGLKQRMNIPRFAIGRWF